MHQPVLDRLEDILEGRRDNVVQEHLASCALCREEVRQMTEHSMLLRDSLALPVGDNIGPDPGFYARVMNRIEEQQKPSIWDTLLDPLFGKRLVYASLSLVLLMSAYLFVSQPAGDMLASSPEVIMAAPNHTEKQHFNDDQQHNREALLTTFASYSD